jgi:hypothetical protein
MDEFEMFPNVSHDDQVYAAAMAFARLTEVVPAEALKYNTNMRSGCNKRSAFSGDETLERRSNRPPVAPQRHKAQTGAKAAFSRPI